MLNMENLNDHSSTIAFLCACFLHIASIKSFVGYPKYEIKKYLVAKRRFECFKSTNMIKTSFFNNIIYFKSENNWCNVIMKI